ncbi:hypothetical protein NADFUDRAFT_49714 [Nadsonia fulvescens var. elongata DSM 6958]|uniref:RecA family profile 1 domain-containing protein n=1 Tax=Nadsonia fulvescens var. elongata DSM 6958 TaxID=857566 RepID=A0A1E3PR08_9ASCO|nr:hypothetical protein NADFUDRAFT_49714 [Nadsonia fulvescens var. elongata DSM 6958]
MKSALSDRLPTLSLSQYIQQQKSVSSIVSRSRPPPKTLNSRADDNKPPSSDNEIYLSTGSTQLDRLINGELESRSLYGHQNAANSPGLDSVPPGIPCSNTILEVSGPSGSGKTLMGVTLSVDYLLKNTSSKKVLWISTNSKPFPKSRFREVLTSRLMKIHVELPPDEIASLYEQYSARVVLMNVDSISELVLLFNHSLSLIYSKIDINKFGFVVVDTLSTLVSLVALGIQLNPPYFKVPEKEAGDTSNINTSPIKNIHGPKDLTSRRNNILTNLFLNLTKFNLVNNSTVVLLSDMICKRDKLLDQRQQSRFRYTDINDSQTRGRDISGAPENFDNGDLINLGHSQAAASSDSLLPPASVTLFPELGNGLWSNFIDARLILFRDSRENSIILNPSTNKSNDDLDIISVPYSQSQFAHSQSASDFFESENMDEEDYLGKIFDSAKFAENQGVPHAMINRSSPAITHSRESSQGLVVDYAKMVRSVKKGELLSASFLKPNTDTNKEESSYTSTNNCLVLLEEISQFLATANFLPAIGSSHSSQLTIRGLLDTIARKTGYNSLFKSGENEGTAKASKNRRYVCVFGIVKWKGICDCNLPNGVEEIEGEDPIKADYDLQKESTPEEYISEVMEGSVVIERKRVNENPGKSLEHIITKRQKPDQPLNRESPPGIPSVSGEPVLDQSSILIMQNDISAESSIPKSNNMESQTDAPTSPTGLINPVVSDNVPVDISYNSVIPKKSATFLGEENTNITDITVSDPFLVKIATESIAKSECELAVTPSEISEETSAKSLTFSDVTECELNTGIMPNSNEATTEVLESVTEVSETVPLTNNPTNDC